ncbi:MAG: aminodeoxychorismate synthase component I [Betaproteobacteria bacterium]|nr:aminodeoxychorismate synthase component I [Betaproteobacteria bacterium]
MNPSIPRLSASDAFAFFDNSQNPGGRCASRLFWGMREINTCDDPDRWQQCLDRVAAGLAGGLYAVAVLSYEFGHCLEPKLAPLLARRGRSGPFFAVAFFERSLHMDSAASDDFIRVNSEGTGPAGFYNFRLSMSEMEYCAAVRAVKRYIEAGDVYQVNLTLKYLMRYFGDPIALYASLRSRQRVHYGGLVRLPGFQILCFSPELFFRKSGDTIIAKPMKGTVRRGANDAEDRTLQQALSEDEKNRAENVMIVDLIRNDLGRVAKAGSVRVDRLFEVEPYETLFQMTSTVSAKVNPGIPLYDLLKSLFPCGSITGAPKIRAMEIIDQLESSERGVYTGSVGYLLPDGDSLFNVAIRTVALRCDGTAELGVGSGITYGSDEKLEYQETLLKACFVTQADPGFQLVESMRCEPPGGYRNLELHLQRLQASCACLMFRLDIDEVRELLMIHARSLVPEQIYKVRLLVSKRGVVKVDSQPLEDIGTGGLKPVALSPRHTRSDDFLLFHKTTARDMYESERARLAKKCGCYEVIFRNERGEITEGSRSNVFVEKRGRIYTPPVSCGLLNGVMRRIILTDPGYGAREQILTPEDLAEADRIFLTNSVRGVIHAALAPRGKRPAFFAGSAPT